MNWFFLYSLHFCLQASAEGSFEKTTGRPHQHPRRKWGSQAGVCVRIHPDQERSPSTQSEIFFPSSCLDLDPIPARNLEFISGRIRFLFICPLPCPDVCLGHPPRSPNASSKVLTVAAPSRYPSAVEVTSTHPSTHPSPIDPSAHLPIPHPGCLCGLLFPWLLSGPESALGLLNDSPAPSCSS